MFARVTGSGLGVPPEMRSAALCVLRERHGGAGVGERRAKLLARRDRELGEHLAEVPLHGSWAEEQLGADLRVGLATGGALGDLGLLRSEVVECLDSALAHGLAGGHQLAAGTLGE